MLDTTAYLRRSLALLAWIDASQPDARVTFGGTELGVWKGISPRWRLEGRQIRLQLRLPDRDLVISVSTVLPTHWGAKIRFLDRCRQTQ
jgi:hypothetical protein